MQGTSIPYVMTGMRTGYSLTEHEGADENEDEEEDLEIELASKATFLLPELAT